MNKALHGGSSDIKLTGEASDCHIPPLAVHRLLDHVDEALQPYRLLQDLWEVLHSAMVDDPVQSCAGAAQVPGDFCWHFAMCRQS